MWMGEYQVPALSRAAGKDEDDWRAGAASLQLVASVAGSLASLNTFRGWDNLQSGGQRGTEAGEKRDGGKELHCQSNGSTVMK